VTTSDQRKTDQREQPETTYPTATAEQVAGARERARGRLAAADAYWTDERLDEAYAEHDRRIADAAA
jgi:hypothetical protein